MPRINYLYFCFYFVLLSLMCASSIFTKDSFNGSRFFFLTYAIGQAALETSFLILIGYTLQYFTNRKIFLTFIGATFFLFVLHFFDFLMERVLDLSVWETIAFTLSETFANFLFLLDASGIPLWGWGTFFLFIAFLPFIGIFFYKITEKITHRKFSFSSEAIPLSAFCMMSGLLFWDFSASQVIDPNTYRAFTQCLPWKFTFLQPKSIFFHTNSLRQPPQEEQIKVALHTEARLNSDPNIYLFIIESFREDFMTQEIAPNLSAFKQHCLPIHQTVANANGTHLSWYSLFHSQFSYNWHLVQEKNWSLGSAPLLFLKKLGYQIHLNTSAQLGYYDMESLLFGQKQYLLDSYRKFLHNFTISAAESDAQAVYAMLNDIQENRSLHRGQIFITFLDSTHFDYSWPKNWTAKFTPFANTISYFAGFFSDEKIQKIKNRYSNAVNYVDHLFGVFLQKIPNKEDAIIIVTGDHGEEFFEKGHLFHCSHIVNEQTHVPILMYFGGKKMEEKRLASQMDVFPTIIDYLTAITPSFMEGTSLLREHPYDFAWISRFNAGRTPYEFCIHNGKYKMIAQFLNYTDILNSRDLKLVSLKTIDDQNIRYVGPKWIEEEFGPALKILFPNK
jgi:hypothetical protein